MNMDHVSVGQRVPRSVVHVPPERLPEGVHQLDAAFGFVERGVPVLLVVAVELLDQLLDLLRDLRHACAPLKSVGLP